MLIMTALFFLTCFYQVWLWLIAAWMNVFRIIVWFSLVPSRLRCRAHSWLNESAMIRKSARTVVILIKRITKYKIRYLLYHDVGNTLLYTSHHHRQWIASLFLTTNQNDKKRAKGDSTFELFRGTWQLTHAYLIGSTPGIELAVKGVVCHKRIWGSYLLLVLIMIS